MNSLSLSVSVCFPVFRSPAVLPLILGRLNHPTTGLIVTSSPLHFTQSHHFSSDPSSFSGLTRRFRRRLSLEDAVKRIFHPELIQRVGSLPIHLQILVKWRSIMRKLLPLGGGSEGNSVTIYFDGDSAFPSMWSAIQQAKQSIRLESYIFEPDAIGQQTVKYLCEAAARGVKVLVLYDSWGSSNLLRDYSLVDQMQAAGVKVVQFNPIMKFPWRRSLLFRNHRKILVVDDQVGFCGGMNIAKEYGGQLTGGTGEFRDTHLKVEGPAALDLARVFNDSYQEAFPSAPMPVFEDYQNFKNSAVVGSTLIQNIKQSNKENKNDNKMENQDDTDNPNAVVPASPASALSGSVPFGYVSGHSVFVQVLKSNVWANALTIQKAMRITLGRAHHRAYITNPYFLPPLRLRHAMFRAVQNGVDVRVLMAGERCDVPFSRWASQYIYSMMLRRGVRIYELQTQTLHAKTVTIDGLYCSVGSFNFDRFSDALNLEVNLTILDPNVASALEERFFKDLENAKEITREMLDQRSMGQKLLHWFAYQIARFAPEVPTGRIWGSLLSLWRRRRSDASVY